MRTPAEIPEKVALSDSTQKLLASLSKRDSFSPLLIEPDNVNDQKVDVTLLITWLSSEVEENKQSTFLLHATRAALLNDLLAAFNEPSKDKWAKKKLSGWAKAKLGLLALAGTLLAICEGFDGILSMLTLFSAVSSVIIFTSGLVFAFLSVVVFYGFDLVEISKNIGVEFKRSPALLDVFIEQMAAMKGLRKAIKKISEKDGLSLEEKTRLRALLKLLQQHDLALDKQRKVYIDALKRPLLNGFKFVLAAFTGALFFGGGFFAGQALAVAIASAAIGSVTLTFWPVLLTSIVIGLAALCIYWFVERPGLENLVGRWFGFDKERIELFSSEDTIEKERVKLKTLIDKLEPASSCDPFNVEQQHEGAPVSQREAALAEENVQLTCRIHQLEQQVNQPGLSAFSLFSATNGHRSSPNSPLNTERMLDERNSDFSLSAQGSCV